jgi:peptidoglycan/xylan/chitin deacetylase (PgdA/CDA1 family)
MDPAFTQLETQLAQRNAPLHVFFRDDDADENVPPLRRLLELFQHWQTPLNLAVIPGRLTEAGRDLLLQAVQATPALIEIHQHGWQHLNHERAGRKCEFGPSRSLAQQLADLAQGQARMNSAFGPHWFPAFVPPWNRCTEHTARALDQLGFRVLSRDRGAAALTGYGFSEIPVTLDLFCWPGGARLRPAAELIEAFRQQMQTGVPVGVMLHHKVMDAAAFAFVETLLRLCRRFPNVRCQTLAQLAANNANAGPAEKQA